jgi:hypothetical protein
MFEMPPPNDEVGYKVCWKASLKHVGLVNSEETSYLEFYDYKGCGVIKFVGYEEGCEAAVDLVNMLVRWDCPSTYDRTIAGRVA